MCLTTWHVHAGCLSLQVSLPLYDPATVLTMAVFAAPTRIGLGLTWGTGTNSSADGATLITKARLKLSTLNPLKRGWHFIHLTGA